MTTIDIAAHVREISKRIQSYTGVRDAVQAIVIAPALWERMHGALGEQCMHDNETPIEFEHSHNRPAFMMDGVEYIQGNPK